MKTLKTVERGAALLDEKLPGWEKKIDLDVLDLSSCSECVAAQIADKRGLEYTRFERGLKKLGVETQKSHMFGFSIYGNGTYLRLTESWKKLIEARRAA